MHRLKDLDHHLSVTAGTEDKYKLFFHELQNPTKLPAIVSGNMKILRGSQWDKKLTTM
jgi:hypothetical protein